MNVFRKFRLSGVNDRDTLIFRESCLLLLVLRRLHIKLLYLLHLRLHHINLRGRPTIFESMARELGELFARLRPQLLPPCELFLHLLAPFGPQGVVAFGRSEAAGRARDVEGVRRNLRSSQVAVWAEGEERGLGERVRREG